MDARTFAGHRSKGRCKYPTLETKKSFNQSVTFTVNFWLLLSMYTCVLKDGTKMFHAQYSNVLF